MALARWQRTIVDEKGDIVSEPNIEVRKDIPGTPLVSLFSDRNGANPITNPFVGTTEGFAAFHVSGGPYRIRAFKGSFEQIWRYVGIGTNSENDFGTMFIPVGAWSNVRTYSIGELVSHENSSGSEPFAFVSNKNNNLNNPPPFTGDVATSDANWTVVQGIESPGAPGDPGSSNVVGSSTTSVAIGTGSKTFTVVEADRGWGVGARLRISSEANPTVNYMEGVVIDYTDPTLQVSIDLVAGGGTLSAWVINLAGDPGSANVSSRTVTAAGAVTVTVNDEVILLNKTSGAATIVNFPPAASYLGRGITLKDIKGDAQTNNITPAFDGSETCDGLSGSSFVIDVNYGDQGVFKPSPNGGWYLARSR